MGDKSKIDARRANTIVQFERAKRHDLSPPAFSRSLCVLLQGTPRCRSINSLTATANAARNVAARRGRRQNDALAFAHRLDRIIQFLETDTSPPNVDEFNKALCKQVREKLKARGEW